MEYVRRVVKTDVVSGAYYNRYDVIDEPFVNVTGVNCILILADVA